MSSRSDRSQQRGEKNAYLSTWVQPETKETVREQAQRQGESVAQYLRRLVRQEGETPKTA
jgi:hypothetical protein